MVPDRVRSCTEKLKIKKVYFSYDFSVVQHECEQ
jgi:hypothetical protein